MKPGIKNLFSVVGVVLTSIVFMFLLASFKSPPNRKPPSDNRPSISVLEVQNKEIQLIVPVIGRLTAHNKVNLLAEVSGVLQYSGKEFLEGQTYSAGEVMLRINKEESELNLKAQRSGLLTSIAALLPELKFDYPQSYKVWNEYLNSFHIDTKTRPLPESQNDREKYFVANKGIYNSYYSIKSQEARLEKYTIRAPFDGVLITSNISPGNLVMGGQVLVTFISPTVFDLETNVSLDEISKIKLGDTAILTSDNVVGEWTGTVSRINQSIGAQTQMVQVFISIAAPELMEQMFLKGSVLTSSSVHGLEMPRKMLHNGSTILEYKNGTIQYRTVDVVSAQGETAVVKGLEDGVLISRKTQGLYNGTEVKVPGLENKNITDPKQTDA